MGGGGLTEFGAFLLELREVLHAVGAERLESLTQGHSEELLHAVVMGCFCC